MKVAFDYNIFSRQEHGGISRYFYALSSQLSKDSLLEAHIVAPFYVNYYIRQAPLGLVKGFYVKSRPGIRRFLVNASRMLSRIENIRFQPDLIHQTYYSRDTPKTRKSKYVLTVFDMIHERFPSCFSSRDDTSKLKAYAVSKADHVFCISEQTKRDLIEILNVPEKKITVTYLASDALAENLELYNKKLFSKPFLLYVGGRDGYKNFSTLLQAYAVSPWLKENFFLVCFGGGKLTVDEYGLINQLNIPQSSIIQMGGGDELLSALYQQAAVLVYPSLYEGFGIPPLEAMSKNCVVACSHVASIPEVVGDAGAYFDPYSVESMRSTLETTLQSPTLCDALIQKGKIRYQQFSWERCALETQAAYRGILT